MNVSLRKLLTISYDGTNYCGWQVQPNGITVQKTVGDKLSTIIKDFSGITGCSRTDSGVHANMFCAHFDTSSFIKNNNIIRAMNTVLPPDISVKNCIDVSDDFHARYSCNGKRYIYKIYNSDIRDPFKEKYYLRVQSPIDCEKLDKCCKELIGTHNFKSFCAAHSSVKDTVRTVFSCNIERQEQDVIFSITGDGFLYNMVRIIVGTLLDINNGKIILSVSDILKTCDRSNSGKTAKPHGLYLDEVFYGEVK